MHRVSIPYPVQSDGRFDWDYYMNKHLPLAVGTSMRHSGVTFCDADKPVDESTPFACVCMVHFDSAASMSGFCNFFAVGHPDSKSIENDEHNYTNIPPDFVTSESEMLNDKSRESDGKYRLKVFFKKIEDSKAERADVLEILRQQIENSTNSSSGLLLSEVDFCIGSVMPDASPSYSIIWANSFDDKSSMIDFYEQLKLSDCLQALQENLGTQAQIMLSEVQSFDLALTAPYRSS